jgi:hypothetical protein
VVEIALVTGYLVAWALRKARRVGAAVDNDVDQVIDAGLDRLHEVVSGRLGNDPALQTLAEEAANSGIVSERTRRRVDDALAEAIEKDAVFAEAVGQALSTMRGRTSEGLAVASGEGALAVAGSVEITADNGSAAALIMGDVGVGIPPDPSRPGQRSGTLNPAEFQRRR